MQLFDLKRIISRMKSKRDERDTGDDEYRRLVEKNQQLTRELQQLSAILDALTFPVWTRNKELQVNYRNKAYAALLDNEIKAGVDSDLLERAAKKLAVQAQETATPCNDTQLITLEGAMKMLQIFEIPTLHEGTQVGFAYDIAQSSQPSAHNTMQAKVDNYTKATSIYGPDKVLEYYNDAFAQMWHLDKEFLDSKPDYGQILNRLRDDRMLPEQANFRTFKENRLRLFDELIFPFNDCLYLPDGRTLQMEIQRYSTGGLIYSFEDITERLSFERSYNMLTAVQTTVLEHLHEGVAVFGQNGRLMYYNSTYAALWKLDKEFLDSNPHINELLDMVRYIYTEENWEGFKADFISMLSERTSRRDYIERKDGLNLERISVPLPDGGMMISYLDITDLKVQKPQRRLHSV
jgi:PAS domain-containing protein